jgi:uncharacterized integral membrane protein (TIGR00697 family)
VPTDADGVSLTPYHTVDGLRAAELVLRDVVVDAGGVLGELGGGFAALDATIDDATLAVCAEAVGIMQVLKDKTIEYSKSRSQFGVPIGSFQALQHRMVDMLTACEQAQSLLLWAAMTCAAGDDDAKRSISSIKYLVGTSGQAVGEEAVQIHGGMGVTWELDVAHYFKRLTAFPQAIVDFYAANQEFLWLTTLFVDLGFTVLLYRLFGKAGLQIAITTAIILANLQGPKLTVIFGLQTSLGVIFYSSIFFATDVLSENYGKAAANKAVRMGFAVSVIVLVMLSLALLYVPSNKPETAEFSASIHNAFATIVNFTPRFIFGSLLAYIISQHFDVWAFHKIRSITGDRWLWLRNNLSTMSSQVVDTLIFSLVTWWGIVDLRTALALGAVKYLFKVAIAMIDTVFIYWAKHTHRMGRLVEQAAS